MRAQQTRWHAHALSALAGGVAWMAACACACDRSRIEPAPTADASAEAAAAEATAAAIGAPPDAAAPCRDGMTRVPAGRSWVGSPDGLGEDDEHPLHEVETGAFCIALRETTVVEYASCVERGRCSAAGAAREWDCNSGWSERGQHPINCITWEQAATYCRSIGGRLPTEHEWERAVRGVDGRIYPWGNEAPDESRLNVCGQECARQRPGWGPMHPGDDGWPRTAPVGSFPLGASAEGLLDAAGNVWEWTADAHEPYPQSAARDPVWRVRKGQRVVRGGGWLHRAPLRVRSANRHSYSPTESNGHIGVRCAADPR